MFNKLIEKEPLKTISQDILKDDEASEFPREIKPLLAAGILEAFIPNHLGGKMGNLEDTLYLGRLLSRRNLTTAIALGQTLLGSLPVWLYGNEKQKQGLAEVLKKGGLNCLALTEEENGSDLSQTNLKDLNGELSGKKWCINNATKGRALCVLSKEEDQLLNIHLILKDHPLKGSYQNIDKIKTLGIRGADISGIEFKNLSQEDSLIGKKGQGLEIILKTMQISRFLCSSFSLGASDTSLRRALEFSLQRQLYGKEIIHLEAVKSKIIKSYQKILLMEAFSLMCARFITMAPEVMSLYSAISKFYVTKLSDEIILSMTEIIGARFYIRDSEFGMTQKILRDHRVVSLFDGSSDVNKSIIAGQLKRLTSLSSNRGVEVEKIFDLKNLAPLFSGEENLKLTNRGRDIIWEYTQDSDLLSKRETLFKKVNGESEIQSAEMLTYVEEYCELTLKANYLLFHHYNKDQFDSEIDITFVLGETELDLALPLEQLKKKCLFSHFRFDIND